jgi:ribosome-binding protein aMBF1 (putative translation factor)
MGQESGRRPKFDLESRAAPRSSEAAQDEHHAFNTVVGEAIRRARQEHGWTQAFLADQARLSPNYIARLERGELGPSLFVANRICEALTIPLEELVGAPAGGATTKKATTKRRAAG